MSIYSSDNLEIKKDKYKIYFTLTQDILCDTAEIEEIQSHLLNLLSSEDENEISFIFDIRIVSLLNIYKYAKIFKNFFMENKTLFEKAVHTSVVITESTLIKVVITPIVKLINTGKPFCFCSTIEYADKYVEDKRSELLAGRKDEEDPQKDTDYRSYSAYDLSVEDID